MNINKRMTMAKRLFVWLLLLQLQQDERHYYYFVIGSHDDEGGGTSQTETRHRVAVIGGGISGTFVTKYLVDYDVDCTLEALHVLDPSETLGSFTTTTSTATTDDYDDNQGSRVATYQTEDGRIIEVGASILSEQFWLIQDMAKSGNLTVGKPFDTTKKELVAMRQGMAISNGQGEILLNTAASTTTTTTAPSTNSTTTTTTSSWESMWTSFVKKWPLIWRYNMDLYLVGRAMTRAIQKFAMAQEALMLSNNNNNDFPTFESPQDLWESVGLQSLVEMSLDEYLDLLWVSRRGDGNGSWWTAIKSWWGMGTLREELVAAVNLVNYNQHNSQVNALTGLASFSSGSSKLYSIHGGNVQLMSSAMAQAQQKHQSTCGGGRKGHQQDPNNNNDPVVAHLSKRVATVVSSSQLKGFELFDRDGTTMGRYDIVILAAPLSMARIDFLTESHMDDSVLQPMPLGGLIPNHDSEDLQTSNNHDDGFVGHFPLPRPLPPSVTRPYTSVVTTIVQNAQLQTEYFFGKTIHDDDHNNDVPLPRGIYMTPRGKALEYNVTAIAQVSTKDNMYKVFSSQPLSREILQLFFGQQVEIALEKPWSGPHGGATPDYQGTGTSNTPFLLFDGATGFHGHTTAGALYYPNALELSSIASMEISAMGAKAVAKLIAKRLQWIQGPKTPSYGMAGEL